jgi:hypothetical protein
MMKYAFMILILIVVLPTSSSAEWMLIELDELVQDSDVIVVGTLSNVHHYSDNQMDYGKGTIQVEEVIWGEVSPYQSLALVWQNETGLICPRVEHKGHENRKGIWLLTLGENGNVRADYPWRFVDLKERQKVMNALLKKTIRLKVSKYLISPDESVEISLIFRNPTKQTKSYPGLEYRNGYLYLNSKMNLELSGGWLGGGKEIAPLANKIVVSEGLSQIIVEPGQEYRVTFNLRELFDIPDETSAGIPDGTPYRFRISGKEFAEVNQISFYQKRQNREGQEINSYSGKMDKIAGVFYRNRNEFIAGVTGAMVMLSVALFSYRFRGARKSSFRGK